MAAEYFFQQSIKCPYCDREEKYTEWWSDDNIDEKYQCNNCGEEFVVEREVEVTYSSYPRKLEASDGK